MSWFYVTTCFGLFNDFFIDLDNDLDIARYKILNIISSTDRILSEVQCEIMTYELMHSISLTQKNRTPPPHPPKNKFRTLNVKEREIYWERVQMNEIVSCRGIQNTQIHVYLTDFSVYIPYYVQKINV